MSAACRQEICTVADTGRCALENDPATCANRDQAVPITLFTTVGTREFASNDRPSDAEGIGAPVLSPPTELAKFPRSTTLDPDIISQIMATRYVTVVGILGDPGSGKTACLASLYLLLANSQLTGWSFADSRSLMAFEETARGARRWNEGMPPEQMTVHTEMADDRRPGFLHLRLQRERDRRCVDLALPDLPGEWTKALVRSSLSDRLEFMRSADVLWLVVDGRMLISKEQRQGSISRLGQLVGRLHTLNDGVPPRMLLVVTHRDDGELPQVVIDRIQQEVAKYSVSLTVIPVAPFSDHEAFKAGHGLPELIDSTVGSSPVGPSFWPVRPASASARAFLSYRRGQ